MSFSLKVTREGAAFKENLEQASLIFWKVCFQSAAGSCDPRSRPLPEVKRRL